MGGSTYGIVVGEEQLHCGGTLRARLVQIFLVSVHHIEFLDAYMEH